MFRVGDKNFSFIFKIWIGWSIGRFSIQISYITESVHFNPIYSIQFNSNRRKLSIYPFFFSDGSDSGGYHFYAQP